MTPSASTSDTWRTGPSPSICRSCGRRSLRYWPRAARPDWRMLVRPSSLVDGDSAVLVAASTVAYCIKSRLLGPGVLTCGVYLATVALTVAAKRAMKRPDTDGLVADCGGSFPSGHTISVIVCLGLLV